MISKTIPATVKALVQDPLRGTTAVLLEGTGYRTSVLPIWIGLPEALAISHALSGKLAERPLTHSLLLSAIVSLDGTLQKIEITKIEKETFYAVLYVKTGTEIVLIDARPSDAIAIALYSRVPILVSENVWKTASVSFDQLGMTHTKKTLRPFRELKDKLKYIREEEAQH